MPAVFRLIAPVLLLLVVSASAFHLSQRQTVGLAGSRDIFRIRASEDENNESSDPLSSNRIENDDVTDQDKTSFAIAKESLRTGIPDEPTTSGPKIDAVSLLLGAYVIFVIVDTVFHITPEEKYSTVLGDAVRGLAGVEGGN